MRVNSCLSIRQVGPDERTRMAQRLLGSESQVRPHFSTSLSGTPSLTHFSQPIGCAGRLPAFIEAVWLGNRCRC
jgi:hypothetical protein